MTKVFGLELIESVLSENHAIFKRVREVYFSVLNYSTYVKKAYATWCSAKGPRLSIDDQIIFGKVGVLSHSEAHARVVLHH